MGTVEFIEDRIGYFTAEVGIRRKKSDHKHPADDFDAIQAALQKIGYEVTGLKFSTPDFMSPIENNESQPNVR